MSNEEAKFILGAYRPSGQDAGDPAMAEALAQAKRDPALGAWFARQQAHDNVVAAKLREIAPPAGLREAILAGSRASRTTRAWWRQPVAFAIAAGFAVMLGIAGFWTTNRAEAAVPLPQFAADYVAGGFFLAQHSAHVDELKTWLAAHKAPMPAELPVGLTQLRALGCKTIDYRGKEISMMCFGQGKEFHLFVARLEDVSDEGATPQPQFSARKKLSVATWTDATHRYVIVTDDSMKALKECVSYVAH